MQNKNYKLNKIIMGTVLASSAVMMATGINALKPNLRVYANSSPTSISIDNSSFASSTSSVSNWTNLTQGTSAVLAKIVDTKNFEDNKENYNLSVNPGKVASSSDNNVFMINSASAVSYGYKSNQFSLNANGYYIVNVPVKTQNGGVASVYLTSEDGFKLSCENIVSNTNYTTYSFYVKTDKTLNVNLQLYLGSENSTAFGAVFFDEITAYSYAENTFYTLFDSKNSQTSATNINTNSGLSYEWKLTDNSKFTKLSENGSNASAEGFVQRVYSLDASTVFPENVKNPSSGNLINNNYALLISNPNSASVGVRYNQPFTLPNYEYMLLSTYVKTNLTSGGLNIKLSTYDAEKDEYTALDNSISNFTTSSSETSMLEGWEKVSFAVKTSAFENKEVYLEFWLGNSSEGAKGYAFIGKLEYKTLTSDEFEGLNTSSSLVNIQLDSKTEDSNSFNNHSFNDFLKEEEYSSSNKAFIKPNKLTKLDNHNVNYGSWNGTDYYASGIVNTNENMFNSINYPFANPGLTPIQAHSNLATQTNNVFAIYQKSNSYQAYKTNDISLNQNSTYKLTVYVKTEIASSVGGARWALYNNDILLSEFKDVVSNDGWTTLTAYVKTGIKTLNVHATLSLGSEETNALGTAFFDDMMVSTCDENEFKSVVKTNTTNVVDLKTDSFGLTSNKQLNGLLGSENWTTNQTSENFIGGVMDTQNVTQNYLNSLNMTNPLSPNGNANVLVINNREDLISTYTNSVGYTLSANSFYKISVWVKTYGLNQAEENINYVDDKNAIPYGASIYIDNIAEKFEGIVDSDWTQYTFFVNSSDDIEMVMHLGLGYNNAKTSGYAYFADVTVESLDEDEYTVQTASYTEDNLPKTVKLVANALKTEDEEDNSSKNNASMGEFSYLIIPTLITGLAIVVAIIGTILRQINFNKFVRLKKKTNSYDRKKVKTKSVRNAEIQNIVNTKVKELTEKLNNLETEQQNLENEIIKYKEEYSSFKNKKLTKEEKQAKKLAKQNYYITYNNLIICLQDISTIKDDINKIQSDKYILKEEYNLMKKTWQEEKQAQKLEKRNQKAKKVK